MPKDCHPGYADYSLGRAPIGLFVEQGIEHLGQRVKRSMIQAATISSAAPTDPDRARARTRGLGGVVGHDLIVGAEAQVQSLLRALRVASKVANEKLARGSS